MTYLVLGLVMFLAIHSVSIVNESWRDGVVAHIGLPRWKGIYTVISLLGFVLICVGYASARHDPVVLYTAPAWMRYATMLLMLFVFPLFLAANLPGRIKAAAKQPLLAATKIWAFAHLLTNGTLADVLLFGSFLAWAVADRISMKRRTQRPIPGAPPGKYNDLIAVVAGLLIYAVFVFWGHHALFGVAV
jgi:uncharacterized membrane protein